MWQGIRERSSLICVGAGGLVLALYGLLHTLQPITGFGRVLAAYGGVFIITSMLWGMVMDGFRPDRYDLVGAGLCLVGIAVITYGPRG